MFLRCALDTGLGVGVAVTLMAKLAAQRAARGGRPPPTRTETSDVQRLLGLRRRPQPSEIELDALATRYTDLLRKPGGTMRLFGHQAFALDEARRERGLFANIGVGRGKTLLSLLLPVVMESHRCVLLIPSGLVEQLVGKNCPELLKHWRIPTVGRLGSDAPVIVVTHHEASQQRTADFLQRARPDLLVIDEGHAFANESARGNRVFHYKREHPATAVCVMSGTLIDGELQGAARMASLTLGDGSPYPRRKYEVQALAECLAGATHQLGDYEKLVGPDENLRSAIRRHVYATPGVVVASGVQNISASLTVRPRKLKVPSAVTAALTKLRKEWVTPPGDELTEAIELARHAIELSQGFCYYWKWPGKPDEEWLSARRNWSRAVRQKLDYKPTPGLDSEGLLRKAASEGRWVTPAWKPWSLVRDREAPPTVAHWMHDFLVEDAVKWGNDEPGIIWYEHRELGPRIAAAGGFPLYDGGPVSARDILNETGDRTIVASGRAHGTGLELQMFRRMYLPCPMSSAKAWEQRLGRLHRQGQRAPNVEVDVCLHTPELLHQFESAQEYSRLLAESAPGYEKLKLLYADVLI